MNKLEYDREEAFWKVADIKPTRDWRTSAKDLRSSKVNRYFMGTNAISWGQKGLLLSCV